MSAKTFFWMRRVMFAAALFCGSAELVGRGDEPNPPAPAQAAAPAASAWTAGRGAHIERLLEDVSPPRPMMWDDRVLYELRLRLAADKDAARRRQQQNEPRPNQWRAGYGDIAPLAIVPQHAEASHAGGLAAYRPEIERLDALMAQSRASAADFFRHGLIHYESGDFRTALRDFDQAIDRSGNPSDQFYSLRGLAYYGSGDYRKARDDLDEAVRRSPNVRNLNNRGVVATVRGETDRALQDFEAALAIRQWTVKRSPVFINRALAMSDLGRQEQAVADLKSVIGTSGDPDAVGPASFALGFVYRRMGDFRQSGFAYDDVILRKRVDDLTAHGQPTQSAINAMPDNHSLLDELAGEETAADALIGRGIAHHELNQVTPAIDDYGKAIRLRPKQTAAYVNRAVAYMDRGDWDLAERDLEAALRLNPNEAFALGNRGLLRTRQGQAAPGQADLTRCVELRQDLQPVLQRILGRGQQPPAAGESPRPSPFATPQAPAPQAPSRFPDGHLRPSPFGAPEAPASQWPPQSQDGRLRPSPFGAPEAPAARPAPLATATTPAHRPYTAATPAEAVEWFAAARKSDDFDGQTEALASPFRNAMQDLRTAVAQVQVAMSKYVAARNAQAGDFFDPRTVPSRAFEPQIEREKRMNKFVVQEMKILSQESAGNTGNAIRLVVRTIKTTARGDTQTPKEIYYAVRERNVWKLLPESAWVAVNDADESRFMASHVNQQVARLNKMRSFTEAAAQAIIDGKPVHEVELHMLAGWSRASAGVPLPGKTGHEPPTFMEEMIQFVCQQVWSGGVPGAPGAVFPGVPGAVVPGAPGAVFPGAAGAGVPGAAGAGVPGAAAAATEPPADPPRTVKKPPAKNAVKGSTADNANGGVPRR
ncbi:MAG: tetratricopeptide repeat protein [Thermoguttaceae bacterium]|jgi:tetratricopeptide (TPR) repeat protein